MTDEGSSASAPASDAAVPAAPAPAAESTPPPTSAPENAPPAAPEVASAVEAPVVEAAPPEASVEVAPTPAPAPEPVAPVAEPGSTPAQELSSPKPEPTPSVQSTSAPIQQFAIKALRGEALESRRARKNARMERIFELKKLNRAIKNDDVERHLKVSDRTAGEYRNELARQGRIEKIGEFKLTRYRFLS